jgi:hypothetical protein
MAELTTTAETTTNSCCAPRANPSDSNRARVRDSGYAPGKIRTCDLSLRRRLVGGRLSGENRFVMRDCGMGRGEVSLGGWPRFAGDSGR